MKQENDAMRRSITVAWQLLLRSGMLLFLVAVIAHNAYGQSHVNSTVPLSADQIKATLDAWSFQYRYDSRRRMIGRKAPGADWVLMVYDNRDRLVLSQDGNQRSAGLWSFTKYDGLNRPVLTGIMDTSSALTQAQMQSVVDGFYSKPFARWSVSSGGPIHGYSRDSYPMVDDPNKYLTVTWYDNYSFKAQIRDSSRLSFVDDTLETRLRPIRFPTSQVTGARLKVLDGGVWGGSTWLTSVKYYDDKSRLIQTIEDNFKGGTNRTSYALDFNGKVIDTKTIHVESDPTWIDRRELSLVGNKVSKTGSGGGWTSGASSEQALQTGKNGWIEAEYTPGGGNVAFGLNDVNTQPTLNDIDYAVNFNGTTLRIYENGSSKLNAGTLQPGDVLRVEREADVVKYRKNSAVIYISANRSTKPLVADIAIHTGGGFMQNIRASFTTSTRAISHKMKYDHTGRLLEQRQKVDEGPDIVVSQNRYNEIGQITEKRLHSLDGVNFYQKSSNRYNIRGWLTSTNGEDIVQQNTESPPLFGFNLYYHELQPELANRSQFNGNISAMSWSNHLGLNNISAHAYLYDYDLLSRLRSADFRTKSESWTNTNSFDESNYTYDKNGNILSLTRNDAVGTIDDLKLSYGVGVTRSNKLMSVTDNKNIHLGFADVVTAGPDYTYDANGNMLTDQNKAITSAIKYNFLNLPEIVVRGAGNSVQHIYDASGRKLCDVTTYTSSQKQTDYVGDLQYENDVQRSIATNEGRVMYARRELIYRNEGDYLTGITRSNASVSLESANGGQSYLKVIPTSKNSRAELIMGSIPVQPGERFVIRLKGYRFGSGTSVHIMSRVNGAEYNWPGASLPSQPSAESWIEQFVTIPSNGQTLSFGAAFSKATSTINIFYLNDIEVFRLISAEPEYQYHLRDHLGNVRLTFTTAAEHDLQTATVEPENILMEQSQFLRYESMRKVSSHLLDHTKGSAPLTTAGYAQRLNGSINERIGLARSLSVMPGDTVRMEVWSKYIDPESQNWTTALQTLMGYILSPAGAPSGTIIDGTGYASGGQVVPSWALNVGQDDGESLNAGLSYILFDANMKPVFENDQTNMVQLSRSALERGQDAAHERLSAEILVKQPGFLYVYLSNNEEQPVEVYFDDFSVEHAKGPVVQSQEYYPFGERFNNYSREGSEFQRELYNNGSPLQTELGLGVYETQYRTYDPTIGRWWQVDPKPDQGGQERWSTYQYSFDCPIRLNDPDGDCPFPCSTITNVLTADAAVNPNGIGAHTLGFGQGISNSIVGLFDAVTHPVETLQGLGNLGLAGAVGGNSWTAMQMDLTFGTNSQGALAGVSNAVSQGVDNLINGDGMQRGQVVGEVSVSLLGAKGLSSGIAGARGALTTPSAGRVFWSGSEIAKSTAATFAKSIGGNTLETTFTGKIANTFSPILPRSISTPMWNALSRNFANGTSGRAFVFTTSMGPRPASIWLKIEKPILDKKGIQITSQLTQ